MIFNCETVAAWGEDETLEAIGARWTEARTFSERALQKAGEVVFYAGFVVGAGGLFGAVAGVFPPVAPVVGVLLVWAAYGLMWLGWRVPGKARELTFWRDGTGFASFGLSTWHRDRDRLRHPHTDIVSIEAEQVVTPKGDDPTVYTHGVRMFFRSGEVSHIAQRMEPDDAHMLAVRLTQSLVQLRESMVTASRGGSRSAGHGRREPERVID